MAIQGLRTTDNFVANARPENWREGILLLYPNGKAPLTALTSMMKSRSVNDQRFHWWEKGLDDRRFALGVDMDAPAAGVVQNITLGAGALSLKQGDVLYVEETGERVFVTQDPGSDTVVSLMRGWAASTPAVVNYDGAGKNPNLLHIGSAYEQGSLAPTGSGFDPTERSNRTQIFRDTLEATRNAMKTRLRTGDQVREAKRECLEYHSIGIERSLFLGKQSATTLNSKPLTTMDGVLTQIDSNNIVTADTSTGCPMSTLEEYMYNIFRYGSSEKMAFCGNRAVLTIQQIMRLATNAQWTFQSGIKEYGMNVSRLVSPFGELVLKTHPLFNQVGGGTTTGAAYYGMESWLVVLDAANLQYVYFEDADTKYQPDLQANGMDGMKSGYLTECSIELHHPTTHYVIKNLAKAVAG